MAVVKGAKPLSEREFTEELIKRLPGTSMAQGREIVKAIKAEIADCLANGYKVTLTSFATFTPSSKPGRKKGTKVANPFKPDAPPKVLRADEPDKFVVKAKLSSTIIANSFPTTRSADGQALLKQLAPAKKRK